MQTLKSTAMWVIHYLIIPVGFMYAAGTIDFIKFMQRTSKESEMERKARFSKAEIATLEITPANYQDYFDSIIPLRRSYIQKHKVNDMNAYFRDLKQCEMFICVYQDSLDHDKESGRMTVFSFNFKKDELVNLNLGVSTANLPEEVAKKHWDDVEKYRAYWFPKDYAKEQKPASRIPFLGILLAIVSWFAVFYLRGFVFAAILFLFWRRRLQRKTEVKLGILSFISSVAIWPYVLFSDIKNRFSEFVSRTEVVSRRNAMLSLFSKQEQKLIEKSKEMTRAEFVRYLDSIGMFRRHSLWLSFVVVVIISITPKTVLASTHVMNAKTIAFEKVFHVLDWDIGDTPCLHSEPEDVQITMLKEIKKIFHVEIIAKLCKGYLRDIGGIPRFKVNFS